MQVRDLKRILKSLRNDLEISFDVYFDKANTLKEKLLFWKRWNKEVRTVLKDITFNSATLGQVKVNGDVWSAVTEEDYGIIPAKSIVRILKIDGVKLVVEPLKIYSTIENSK